MHAEDLRPIKEKLFEFMSGWLGGPPLYFERRGSICITKAHSPFPIGERERDQWLLCMHRALEDIEASETVREMMRQPLYRIADFLRNQ
jgi:hemoglobin